MLNGHPLAIDRADAFTYASSRGLGKWVKTVEFSTGHNEAYVARWTGIRPGADGKIIIRTTHTVGEANGAPAPRPRAGMGCHGAVGAPPAKGWWLSMTVPTRMVARKTPTSPPSILGEPALVLPGLTSSMVPTGAARYEEKLPPECLLTDPITVDPERMRQPCSVHADPEGNISYGTHLRHVDLVLKVWIRRSILPARPCEVARDIELPPIGD